MVTPLEELSDPLVEQLAPVSVMSRIDLVRCKGCASNFDVRLRFASDLSKAVSDLHNRSSSIQC